MKRIQELWRRMAWRLRRKSWVVAIFDDGGFALARVPRGWDRSVSARSADGSTRGCTLITDQGSLQVYRVAGVLYSWRSHVTGRINGETAN